MTAETVDDFRRAHEGDIGARALADSLMELGLLGFATNDEQRVLRNYAVQLIAKMGVVTDGEKYSLLYGIAKLLQQHVPSLEE